MYRDQKKVSLEFNNNREYVSSNITNPIDVFSDRIHNLEDMVTKILDKEIPMLKNNTLLHNMVLYSVIEKLKTVQTVENVLSYIKKKNVKEIEDVKFENGEVCIKCSM